MLQISQTIHNTFELISLEGLNGSVEPCFDEITLSKLSKNNHRFMK